MPVISFVGNIDEIMEEIPIEEKRYNKSKDAGVTIENNEVFGSLPSAEELKVNGEFDRGLKTKTKIYTGLVLLALIAVIVGLDLGLSKEESSRSNFKRYPGTENIIDFVLAQGVSTEDSLSEISTPQQKACIWLGLQDPALLPVPKGGLDTIEGYKYITRYIMAVNYFALGGSQWDNKLNFMSGKDVCDWNDVVDMKDVNTRDIDRQGLFCDPQTKEPLYLILSGNNLAGKIPRENGLLRSLMFFDMRENSIDGVIPSELCKLSSLRSLFLSENDLVGEIPDCLGEQVDDLEFLALSHNHLSGPIPDSLAKLNHLERLLIDSNTFSGDPTYVFNALVSLKVLAADHNSFTGEITDDFLRKHVRLNWLDLSHNQFTTDMYDGFPQHLLRMPQLSIVDISNNKLHGMITTSDDINEQLEYLDLSNNQLQGSFPSELKHFKKLDHLDLSSNKFSGSIPPEIGEITSLVFLFLSGNPALTPGAIPETFGSLINLEELSLRNTVRTGQLPSFIGNLNNLIVLDLGSNALEGDIPESYSKLEDLQYLLLNNNNIQGQVPATVQSLTELRGVILTGLNITGSLDMMCTSSLPMQQSGEIYADCNGIDSEISCSCCTCCNPKSSDDCAMPFMQDLDGAWETDFQRRIFDFTDQLVQ